MSDASRLPGGLWQQASGRGLIVIRPEIETEPLIVDAQIAVVTTSDRIRSHRLHFLRDHPDIDFVAAVVGETIVTKTVVEPPEQPRTLGPIV